MPFLVSSAYFMQQSTFAGTLDNTALVACLESADGTARADITRLTAHLMAFNSLDQNRASRTPFGAVWSACVCWWRAVQAR